MEKLQHTMEGALDTILWFEDSLHQLELKSGELLKLLESHELNPEPCLELFKIFSQIRFHLAEAEEYKSLLNHKGRRPANGNHASLPLPAGELP